MLRPDIISGKYSENEIEKFSQNNMIVDYKKLSVSKCNKGNSLL